MRPRFLDRMDGPREEDAALLVLIVLCLAAIVVTLKFP